MTHSPESSSASSDSGLPLVSIIVASYNHADFVETCLESIVEQTGLGVDFELEIVIVDDSSSDESCTLIEKYLDTSSKEVKYSILRKTENRGLKHSLDLGLKKARGQYIQIIASDDFLVTDKIKRQIAFLGEKPDHCAVYGECVLVSAGKLTLQSYPKFAEITSKGGSEQLLRTVSRIAVPLPMAQSAVFRRSDLSEAFAATRDVENDDWSLMIKLAERARIGHLASPTVFYRVHDRNSHHQRDAMLVNQLEVVLLVVGQHHRRHALEAVLRVQALTFWSLKQRKRAIAYALLSVTATGRIAAWGRFLFAKLRRNGSSGFTSERRKI